MTQSVFRSSIVCVTFNMLQNAAINRNFCPALHLRIRCEWDDAAKFANLLRLECNWSPATYTYQYATFLYMQVEDDKTKPELKARVTELIRSVPGLRIRYA